MRETNVELSHHSHKKNIFLHLLHVLFAKFSFISKTLLLKNHINILILSGIFNFQRYLRKNLVFSLIKSIYIDLIVNMPVGDSFHTNLSRSLESWTIINRWYKCYQSFYFLTVKTLTKPIFSGVWARTLVTKTFLWCTMLYNDGYCCTRNVFLTTHPPRKYGCPISELKRISSKNTHPSHALVLSNMES
jgi:hypothetical protein